MSTKTVLIAVAAMGTLVWILDRWPPATQEGNEQRRKLKDTLKLAGLGASALLIL